MKLLYFFLFLFLVTACAPNKEETFLVFNNISYPTDTPFSISVYKNYDYFIDYQGSHYLGKMHPDSSVFSILYRYYTNAEVDSLGLTIGNDYLAETISLDNQLAEDLTKISLLFKRLRTLDSNLYLDEMSVDETHSLWLKVRWNRNWNFYYILITDDFNQSIQNSSESNYEKEYIMITPSVFYRNLHYKR